MPISLCVIGAAGKMGRKILSLALSDPNFTIASACVSQNSPFAGQDIGALLASPSLGVLLGTDPESAATNADLLIDFSLPSATTQNIQAAVKGNKPLLIGTTGLSIEMEHQIIEAAKQIPILHSPNYSLGIALCLQAASQLARSLNGKSFIEIHETHHISKKDSPSGTALAFAKATGHSAPIHSIRSGEAVGEHRVIFTCQGERIELKHEALSRDAFAKGALAAAQFLVRQPPGIYHLKDIFSLS